MCEETIACLDRLCINCWCGQSLIYEQDDDSPARPVFSKQKDDGVLEHTMTAQRGVKPTATGNPCQPDAEAKGPPRADPRGSSEARGVRTCAPLHTCRHTEHERNHQL
jgi:hypothetical protein